MPAIVANPVWGVVAGRESAVQVRTDYPARADYFYKNRNRFAVPQGPAFMALGVGSSLLWAYRMIDYVPPRADPVGGAERAEVGQLTP